MRLCHKWLFSGTATRISDGKLPNELSVHKNTNIFFKIQSRRYTFNGRVSRATGWLLCTKSAYPCHFFFHAHFCDTFQQTHLCETWDKSIDTHSGVPRGPFCLFVVNCPSSINQMRSLPSGRVTPGSACSNSVLLRFSSAMRFQCGTSLIFSSCKCLDSFVSWAFAS